MTDPILELARVAVDELYDMEDGTGVKESAVADVAARLREKLKQVGWAVRLQHTDQFDGDKTTTGFGRWHLTAIASEAANITPPNQKVPVYTIAVEDKEEASDGE